MRRIREACLADRAKYLAEVLPPIVVDRDSIAPCPEISASFERFRRREPTTGLQWGWLARLARGLGSHLELGLQAMRTHGPVYESLRPYVERSEGPWGWTHVLRRHPDPDTLAVFSHFTYPILHLTKVDIERVARERGFLGLLELSRFCHRSTTGRPCGICAPCQVAIREGLGRRVGWPGLVKYYTIARVDGILPPAARAAIRRARRKAGRPWLTGAR